MLLHNSCFQQEKDVLVFFLYVPLSMRERSQAAGSNRQWHCSKGLCIFCASHYQASATVNKSQPAIFLSLKTYFTNIKICSVVSTFPDSLSDIHVCIRERLGFFHDAFSVILIDLKLCYIAAEIWNEKENRLLYRMPLGTGSLISCISQGTECHGLTKIHGPTEVYLLKVMLQWYICKWPI